MLLEGHALLIDFYYKRKTNLNDYPIIISESMKLDQSM